MKSVNKILIAVLGTVVILTPVLVLAQATLDNPIDFETFPDLFEAIAMGVLAIIGGISTIMVIWAGILYLTSAGSPEKMGTARKALMYAIIGIVVASGAAAIVAFIKTTMGAT